MKFKQRIKPFQNKMKNLRRLEKIDFIKEIIEKYVLCPKSDLVFGGGNIPLLYYGLSLPITSFNIDYVRMRHNKDDSTLAWHKLTDNVIDEIYILFLLFSANKNI